MSYSKEYFLIWDCTPVKDSSFMPTACNNNMNSCDKFLNYTTTYCHLITYYNLYKILPTQPFPPIFPTQHSPSLFTSSQPRFIYPTLLFHCRSCRSLIVCVLCFVWLLHCKKISSISAMFNEECKIRPIQRNLMITPFLKSTTLITSTRIFQKIP